MTAKRVENAKHRQAFEVWYACNRDFAETSEKLRESWTKCSERTLYTWSDAFGWKVRADERDEAAAVEAERIAVRQKAQMLVHHAEIAGLLINRAAEWLSKHELDTASDSIRALQTGVKIERESAGLPSWIFDLANASEDELIREYERLRAEEQAEASEDGSDPGRIAQDGQPESAELVGAGDTSAD